MKRTGKLKWIVLYNSAFSNNHKELFKKLQELSDKGVLELVKQCDFVKDKSNMKRLIESVDLKEILTPKTAHLVEALNNLEDIMYVVAKNPKKTLKMVISLWYYKPWDEYTRIDVGEIELLYLLDSERRMSKWNKKN